jgi:hypothetical protein
MYLAVKLKLLITIHEVCMSRLNSQAVSLYGTPQPLSRQNPFPIIAKRDPAAGDTGYALGQLWINKVTNTIFGLGSVVGGAANWVTLGNLTSTYTALTSASYATTTANAITLASGNVFTGTGANAAIGFTFTPKGAGDTVFTTGNVTLSSGNLVLTSGNATLTSGNLVLTSGNATLTSGNLILTSGHETITDGNLLFGTAGKGLSIKSGANARIGQATLAAGTFAVVNTSVTANTRVFITRVSINGSTAVGTLEAVPAAGVGFTINALTPATAAVETNDISIVDWVLIESA